MDIKMNNDESIHALSEDKTDQKFRYKATAFLVGVAGISSLMGFGSALASAKKSDPSSFNKGIAAISKEIHEPGAMLALRALGWGTFYAFSGCGILFYSIWKLSGAENLKDFRLKMGSILPVIPKNNPPQGRTEFSGMNDLMEYLQTLKSNK